MLRTIVRFTRPSRLNASHFLPKLSPCHVRTLTTTLPRFQNVSTELATKLGEEIAFESELSSDDPPFLTTFKNTNLFQIHDTLGLDEVKLTRTYKDEKITVVFSTSDINNLEESSYEGPDDEVAEEQEVEEEKDDTQVSFPFRLNVTVEKAGHGVLAFDLVSEEGQLGFESVTYNHNPNEALDMTAEGDYKRRGNYNGPQFGHLDEGLQVLLERYVEERGIDEALLQFVPNYMEHKEQLEYVNWLKNVKGFVEA
jgi:complement component 1 Q subcomponent-binding protein